MYGYKEINNLIALIIEALYYGMESIEDMTDEKFADLDLDRKHITQLYSYT